MTTAGATRLEPASVGQRLLWMLERHQGRGGQLNYPLLLDLHGPLDQQALDEALTTLATRHESLRTTFTSRRGLLTQVIAPPGPVPIHRVPHPAGAATLDELVDAEVRNPVDPRREALRCTLWSAHPGHHVLALNAHHLTTDAWSCRVLVEDLVALLADRPLPAPGWQYRHFAHWQRRRSALERARVDGAYWSRQLEGVRPCAAGRSDLAAGGRPELAEDRGQEGERSEVAQALDRQSADAVRRLARLCGTTPFVVLLSVFLRALALESGQRDLAVAAPFANRVRPEASRTVGFFANLLILRARVDTSEPLQDVVPRIRTTVNEAMAHQGFARILPPAQSGREAGRRVEDIVFQMLPPLPEPVRAGSVQVGVRPPRLPSRFALEMVGIEHPDGVAVQLQHAPDHFATAAARRVMAHAASELMSAGEWSGPVSGGLHPGKDGR